MGIHLSLPHNGKTWIKHLQLAQFRAELVHLDSSCRELTDQGWDTPKNQFLSPSLQQEPGICPGIARNVINTRLRGAEVAEIMENRSFLEYPEWEGTHEDHESNS